MEETLQIGDVERKITPWQWIKKELKINKKTLLIKAVMFLFMGGIMSFLAFLTLHMQEIGLTLNEAAIMFAVLPITSLIGPPLSGLIADKTGRYTVVLAGLIILTALSHSIFLVIPIQKRGRLEFGCNATGFSMSEDTCDGICSSIGEANEIQLQNCTAECVIPSAGVSACLSTAARSKCFPLISETNHTINTDASLIIHKSDICLESRLVISDGESSYGNFTCSNPCEIICDVEPCPSASVFYAYFGLRLIANLFSDSAFGMLDAVALKGVENNGGDYGKQRAFFMLGQAIGPLIASILVYRFNSDNGSIDYGPAFYFGDVLLLMSVLLLTKIDVKFEDRSQNIMKDLLKLITIWQIDVFLFMLLILGSYWGFLENLLFVYLKALGAPTYLLGLTLTVGCLVGVPVLFCGDYIVRKLGRTKVICISFICYFIRLFGYSYMPNAWYCFPLEILEIFTYQLMWIAAIKYGPLLAPKSLFATMTSISNAAHFSLGRGIGSFIGGRLMHSLGHRLTFRYMGLSALGGAALFLSIDLLVRRRKSKRELNLAKTT